jgi:MFS transporter, Spinster family, sphingosine-1-phosphate transporter
VSRARYAWAVVALLWLVALLNYLDRQVLFSVLPLVRADLDLSDVEIGLAGAVFVWVYGILSPVAGYLGDRFGRVRIIVASLLVWSAVTWATGHARTASELLWARALMGISEACYLPAGLALIADYHGDRSRSLATGLHFSGIYAGMVIGGAGGGWMGERYGWRAAFTILGMAGIAYCLLLKVALREAPARGATAPRPRFAAALAELLRLRGFVALTAVFGATSIANWTVYTWLPLYLYERFGMSLAAAGFMATFYIQAGSVAGILAGGRLADAWARRSGSGRLLTQAVGLGAAAPFLFLAGSTGTMPLLIAGLLLFGIGRGMYDCNAMPVLAQIARPELRSTGYGIFNCAGCLAGGVMAAVAGVLKSALGLTVAFQTAAVILFLSAFALARLGALKGFGSRAAA